MDFCVRMKGCSQFLLGIGVMICIGCSGSTDSDNEVYSNEKFELPKVEISILRKRKFNHFSLSSGKVVPERNLKILAGISGIIKTNLLTNNRVVSQGQVLVVFDKKEAELKLMKIKDQVYNNRLNYQSDYLGVEGLLKNSSKNLRDSVIRKLKASSGLTLSDIDYQIANLELSKYEVRAPFTGMIANANLMVGSSVKSGEELCTIYSHQSLLVETDILEADINYIEVGQPAIVTTVGGEKSYKAKVVEINPLVNSSGLVTVKLTVMNSINLLPGMNSVVKIAIPSKNSLVIPKSALVLRDGKNIVFTSENNLAKWNYVKIGNDNGAEVEIRSGLKEGQKIIISNNSQLANDAGIVELKKK